MSVGSTSTAGAFVLPSWCSISGTKQLYLHAFRLSRVTTEVS